MEKLIEYIVKAIVQKPEKVVIEKNEGENAVEFRLKLDPDDIKFVIGKKGKTIGAIRNLLRVKTAESDKRVNLEIVD